MVSGWHITHLPVRVSGASRVWRIVDEVVVSWSEFRVEGFLLTPRPFRVLFIPGDAGVTVSTLGIEISERKTAERRSKHWRREVLKKQQQFKNRPVVDQTGRLHGRLKDFLFDERTLQLTHLIVSRGLMGDLLSGAYLVPVGEVTEMEPAAIKIFVPGEPFPMR
ncbi:MAG: PRC-barrel domain-containing protein [Firmicutes bacterium]|nr:PRC-barrel domain-containing protein [Bacillota bacterium]